MGNLVTMSLVWLTFCSIWISLTLCQNRKALAIVLAFAVSILSDTHFSTENIWRFLPGYGALVLHALCTSAYEHTLGVLSPSLGTSFTIAASTLGATIFALPFYLFRTVMVRLTWFLCCQLYDVSM